MILKILTKIGLLAGAVAVLLIIGNAVDGLIAWDSLTALLSAVRRFWSAANWFWDIPTMISLITISLGLDLAEWAFTAGMVPIHWFKDDNKPS